MALRLMVDPKRRGADEQIAEAVEPIVATA
jgi:hypothetical protein